jgi:hypothetical protein
MKKVEEKYKEDSEKHSEIKSKIATELAQVLMGAVRAKREKMQEERVEG